MKIKKLPNVCCSGPGHSIYLINDSYIVSIHPDIIYLYPATMEYDQYKDKLGKSRFNVELGKELREWRKIYSGQSSVCIRECSKFAGMSFIEFLGRVSPDENP